jgi:hypothetical protein
MADIQTAEDTMTRKMSQTILALAVLAVLIAMIGLGPVDATLARLVGFTPTAYVYLPAVFNAPTPTYTPTPAPPGWLSYLNTYRDMANLPLLTENSAWSYGDWLHSRYCVKNNTVGHTEDTSNPWYTPEGLAAAQNGNMMVSSTTASTDEYAIDLWMQGPFHALGILDPHLLQTGFGSYRENVPTTWKMAATLDVLRGRGSLPPSVTFPVEWPGNGKTVGLTAYGGSESPDPLASCSGYSAPSGLPIILQIGSGSLTPSVTAHSFKQGSTSLDHCVFDETNYTNPTADYQILARAILDARDAIVLIPRSPLTPGASYTVSITSNGNTTTWTFTVSSAARTPQRIIEAQVR